MACVGRGEAVLVGKREEERPFERPRRRRRRRIILVDLQEVGWGHGLDQSG